MQAAADCPQGSVQDRLARAPGPSEALTELSWSPLTVRKRDSWPMALTTCMLYRHISSLETYPTGDMAPRARDALHAAHEPRSAVGVHEAPTTP